MTKAVFDVELKDDVSKGATAASSALKTLKESIEEDTKKLREMGAAMGRLKGSSAEVAAAKDTLKSKIDATKDSLASAQAKYLGAGGALGDIGKKAELAGGALDTQGASAASSGAKVDMMAKGMAVAAGAMLAAAAAAGVAAAALLRYGLGAADAARSSRLLAQAWAGSKAGGDALLAQVSALSQRIPLAKGSIQEMGIALMRSGFQGNALALSLEASATAAAVLGDAAGAKLTSLAERAKTMRAFMAQALDFQGSGITLDETAAALAKNLGRSFAQAKAAIQSGGVKVEDGLRAMKDAVNAKFGEIAGAQMLSFPAQLDALKADLAGLFSGVEIEPFLRAFKEMRSVFDGNTVAGRALRDILSRAFNSLGPIVERLAPIISAFFKGIVIGALLIEIGVLKLRTKFVEAFGPSTTSKIDFMKVALYAGAAAVGLIVAAAALAIAPFAAMAGAMSLVQSASTRAANAVRAIDWASVGRAALRGLTLGLLGGEAEAQTAMKGISNRLKSTAASSFEQKSPSKFFERVGRYNMAGLTKGHEAGESEAQSSLESALDIPNVVAPKGIESPSSARAPTVVNIEVHFATAPSADDMNDPGYVRKLARALEEAAAMSGLLPVAT